LSNLKSDVEQGRKLDYFQILGLFRGINGTGPGRDQKILINQGPQAAALT
jgi:hypothetical protein